jgi:formylglycine-generating enzyme required for sulfatase activity
MKKNKQEPIFSKVHGMSEEFSPAKSTPPDSLWAQGDTAVQIIPESRVEISISPQVALPLASLAPESENLPNSEPTEALVIPSFQIIQPALAVDTTVNSLGMAFVLIPADTFLMGSPEHEPGRHDDETQHEVTISRSFHLQITPVTQGQWQSLMGKNAFSLIQAEGDQPVDGINWNDCQKFIKKLNALGEGIYRLPSEAEWEYACRAGSSTALPNGDLTDLYCDLDPNLDEIGWYCGNSDNSTQPVAQKSPNSWGLYDMCGNVAEWCQDWYGPYSENTQIDPNGPTSGPGRVVRGGSWFSSAKNCRSAARFYWPPNSRNQLNVLGFRLIRDSKSTGLV